MDDFLVCVQNLAVYHALVVAMRERWDGKKGWEVKELGLPSQFLSLDMDITLDAEGRCTKIILSQHSAISDLVERFPYQLSARSASTPMTSGDIVGDHVMSKLLPNNNQYSSLIGSFIYFATCTRADISHAVSILSKFSAAPTVAQWEAAKRLLQYLRDNRYLGLCYQHTSSEFKLTVFSDSSYAECKDTRKSQTGVAILAAGTLVNWVSKRQVTPAIATAEAEYQALSSAAREILWLKSLTADLGFFFAHLTIQCDSTGAIGWSNEWKRDPKAKHIDIIHHWIKDLVKDKRLRVIYVNTKDNQADPFTKTLEAKLFWIFVKLNGMISVLPSIPL